ncbi:glycosyltransferase family 4 protein [Ramlibacter monticola]|uniref:Glycosyltransferase family 4 protein n=1 Tax=Ramlibacter monticola TaxID=1926872 RepID=A0A937CTH3_9BURK|nr:glycosyltransferase family 4 protein [Ramlibacter monticola]MBL0391067.1 glycosyltransferase family 4 protein [Ramlibacter monticola]
MKILILSQHFWPEQFRISELALHLRDTGCEVTVLTGKPNYPEGRVYPGYRAGGTQCEEYEGVPVFRVPLVPRSKGGIVSLALNYFSYILSAAVLGPWLLRGREFDVIFVYGTSPILQAIPGVVLRWLKRARLVVWVQDLWPESMQAAGFIHNRRILDAVACVVRWIYRRSDLLLVQSHAFAPAVAPLAGGTPVEYYPNPGEKVFHQADEEEAAAARLRLEPGFNVVFAGNLGRVQGLECILDAAEILRDHPDVRVVLVGSGQRSEWLKEQVGTRKLHNVQLPGRFPVEAMPGIFAQASALLLTLARNPVMSLTIPSKLQAYLAAGRPVIGSLDGEGARVVVEAGAGLACPAEDARALAEAVLRLRALDAAQREAMGRAGREYYLEHFEPTKLAHRLADRFGQLQ